MTAWRVVFGPMRGWYGLAPSRAAAVRAAREYWAAQGLPLTGEPRVRKIEGGG